MPIPTKLLLSAVLCSLPTIAFAQTTDATTASTSAPAATQADGAQTIELEGYLAAVKPFEAKVELKSFSGGPKVKQVVPHGATVRQGETLITFDTTEIDDQILLAASELDLAKASLAKAEADVSLGDRSDAANLEQRQDAVKDAELALEYWKKLDGPDFLKQLEMQRKSGQFQIDDQNDELDQLRKMYQSESLTNATADIVVKRAVRQLEMTKESVAIQQGELEKQKATTYVDKQQEVERGLASAKQSLDAFNADSAHGRVQRADALTKARVALRGAQRKLSELEQDKAAMTITAPSAGVAFFGHVGDDGKWQNAKPDAIEVDDKKDAGATLLTVVTPGKVAAIAKASDEQVTKLKVGQSAKLAVTSADATAIEGKVLTISPLPASDGTFEVGIEVAAGDAKLLPGMKTKIEVTK